MEKMFFVSMGYSSMGYSPRVWVCYPEDPTSRKDWTDEEYEQFVQTYKKIEEICPSMNRFSIWGGADKAGKTFKSWEISEEKVQAVSDWLKSQGFREVCSEEAANFCV